MCSSLRFTIRTVVLNLEPQLLWCVVGEGANDCFTGSHIRDAAYQIFAV